MIKVYSSVHTRVCLFSRWPNVHPIASRDLCDSSFDTGELTHVFGRSTLVSKPIACGPQGAWIMNGFVWALVSLLFGHSMMSHYCSVQYPVVRSEIIAKQPRGGERSGPRVA
jgi:hypothetical protein